MRIPEKIQIAGLTYEVVLGDGKYTDFDENGEEVEVESVGHIKFLENEIIIDKSMSKQAISVTFCHELVHGITMAMGFQPNSTMPNDEVFTEAFGQLMYQVFQQLMDDSIPEAEPSSDVEDIEEIEEDDEFIDDPKIKIDFEHILEE